ncbi:Vegetative cell wall protein gp1 precursor (Hydroxyproline-rich glycoprotein 1) [Minicystis rosea]|nr:Vegetative cell wall protein gp1 precursor (Hydroxyproline-rich glycoprotein 1) [Minicystis rosea]
MHAARAMHARLTSVALVVGATLLPAAAHAQAQTPPVPAAPQPPAPPPPAAQPAPPAPAQPSPAPAAPPPSQQQQSPAPASATPPPEHWQSAASEPSPAELPPGETAPKLEGVTTGGLPFSQRGGFIADVSAMRFSGASAPSAAIDILARIPLADHTFLDAVIPIGFGAIGNPMVGAHHVFRPQDRFWINLGGAVGVPLVNSDGFDNFQYARAFWDLQEFSRYTIPFVLRFGLEGHAGLFEFRAQAEPVVGISVKKPTGSGSNRANHLFALQHAAEIQIGHAIGGGIRYQGVAIPTDIAGITSSRQDHYQATMEIFFRIYRDPMFARLGLVLPLDAPLGEIDDARSWGVHVQTGFNLD